MLRLAPHFWELNLEEWDNGRQAAGKDACSTATVFLPTIITTTIS
jgi:hypothetical protein